MTNKEALVIIDMQYFFISTALKTYASDIVPAVKIVPAIKNCLYEARQFQVPIIHIKTEYKEDKSNWPKTWLHYDSLYCMHGTHEAEIISEISPIENEAIIIKSRFSGFFKTDLEAWLVKNDINSVVIAGYALDGCVRFTAVDAFNLGIKTTILSDCVMAAQEDTKSSLEYLQFLIQSSVIESKLWLSSFH